MRGCGLRTLVVGVAPAVLLDFRLQVLHRIPISWQAPLEFVEDVLRDGLTAKMLRQARAMDGVRRRGSP